MLVTRPEPGATRTGDRLREIGHDAVLLPLSRIVAVTPTPVPTTLGFLAAVVTSASAVRHMPVSLHRRISELPLHVVGDHTAREAVEAGFDVRSVSADSDDLAGRLESDLHPGASIAYPCGRVRMPELEVRLAARDILVTPIEVYDTIQFSHPTDFVIEKLSGPPIGAALVFSVLAARQVSAFIASELTGEFLAKSIICCMSPRIAQVFEEAGIKNIAVAASPGEDELMALLARE